MNRAFAGLVAFVLAAGLTVTVGDPSVWTPDVEGLGGASVAVAATPVPSEGFGKLDADAVRGGVGRPAWPVGTAWDVRYGPDEFPCRLVVVKANASGYALGSACDAGETVSVQLATQSAQGWAGPFTRDIAGLFPGGEPIAYYDWPLRDNKTWDITTFDGEELEVTARFVPDIAGPFGPEPGYVLEAVDGDYVAYRYDYLPSLRWWSRMEFPGSGYVFRVAGANASWSGDAITAAASGRFSIRPLLGPDGYSTTFSLNERDERLYVVGSGNGIHYAQTQIIGPDGTQRGGSSRQATGGSTFDFALIEGEPGQWELRLTGAAVQGQLTYRGWGVDLTTWRVGGGSARPVG